MSNWTLYGISGNPSYEITKAWLKNHGISFEDRSLYFITNDEVRRMAKMFGNDLRGLSYPDEFSFSILNPQKQNLSKSIRDIQSGKLSDQEVIKLLTENPNLILTPILTNFDKIVVGYDYEKLVSTFRHVKVKDVRIT
jgi:arsenate reductase-like glutaredoxin family protein